jgi:hypothetical protein
LINDFGVVRIWPAGQEPSNDLSTALAPPTAFAFEASNSLSWENADAFHSIELYQDDGQGRGQNLYLIATVDPGTQGYVLDDVATGEIFKIRHIRDRGEPSAFLSLSRLYRDANGRVCLQSDDGNWYFVGLTTDLTTQETTLEVDQTAQGAPTYGDSFIDLNFGGDSYHITLSTDFEVDGGTTIDVAQTPNGGLSDFYYFKIGADDGLSYSLTLVNDGRITYSIAQTAVGAPEIVGGLGISSASLDVILEWVDNAGDSYEVQYQSYGGGAWNLAGVVAAGVQILNFTPSGYSEDDTIPVRIRGFIGIVPGKWANTTVQLQV